MARSTNKATPKAKQSIIIIEQPKRSGGQPTKYKPEYCEALKVHMAKGFSFEAFAAVVGTYKETLYDWARTNQDFAAAKREAFEACRMFWEKVCIDHIVTVSESDGMMKMSQSRALNSTAWIFNMRNRFNWRNESDPSADPGAATQDLSPSMTRAEALQKLAEKNK